MYLIDTNVVSELRKAKSASMNQGVLAWSKSVPAPSLFLSVITILELEKGVLGVARRDPAQAAVLRRWLDGNVLQAFSGRILPIDTAVRSDVERSMFPIRDLTETLSLRPRH